jgi:hypothetical protein
MHDHAHLRRGLFRSALHALNGGDCDKSIKASMISATFPEPNILNSSDDAAPEFYDGGVASGVNDSRLVYMMDEAHRASISIHEAAHAEYMERIGDIYVEFIPLPDEERYRYCDALVTNHRPESEDLVQMQADPLGYIKSIVAAGIAQEVLTGRDGGTAFDEDETEEMFDALGIADEERWRLLDQARLDILKDLRSPAFRKRLWARAGFYQRILEQAIYPNGRVVPLGRRALWSFSIQKFDGAL